MKKVPFYANHEDDMHCAVAVYRMLFDYFMDRQLSWEEMEKMSGFKPGKAAWTVTIWERMAKQGFDIRMIEAFDYEKYAQDGDTYLRTFFSPTEYKWYAKHSNLLEIRGLIPSFLEQVKVETSKPTLDDLDEMLNDERLVFLEINSRALDGEDGFAAHAVLVIGKDGDDYVVHDPGTTPKPNRHIPRKQLWEAMGGGKASYEMTGVKFKPRPVRADVLLADMHPLFSRAALAKLFKKGLVKHDGKILKAGDKILSDVALDVDTSSLQASDATIDLPILYEDDDVVVINKPAGVLTHVKGTFSPEATVASFLRQRAAKLTGERGGIVHRLDRATSGVLIGAKNTKALGFLQKQFADRTVQKTYAAIIEGELREPTAIIDMPIERNPKAPATFRVGPNGKPAVTRYKTVKTTDKYSLLELKPETGRTHQLRVHLLHQGHPIAGDTLYGGKPAERLFLHARSLTITLPNGEQSTFEAPLPEDFEQLLGSS